MKAIPLYVFVGGGEDETNRYRCPEDYAPIKGVCVGGITLEN